MCGQMMSGPLKGWLFASSAGWNRSSLLLSSGCAFAFCTGRKYISTGADCVHSDQKWKSKCPTCRLDLGETVLLMIPTPWRRSAKDSSASCVSIRAQWSPFSDGFLPCICLTLRGVVGWLSQRAELIWEETTPWWGIQRNSRRQKEGGEAVQSSVRDHPFALGAETSC